MPRALSPDHPNLIRAASRLRRIHLTWAVLFGGTAALSLVTDPQAVPVQWVIGAIMLILSPQPALLGMVAVLWGLSLLGLLPELNRVFLIDPAAALFELETIERLALAFVRVVLLVMAWNQLLFYRMLYGAPSPEAGLPPIPEVIQNETARLALSSQLALIAGSVSLLLAIAFDLNRPLLAAAFGLSSLAIGLGVGVAFSPTRQRGSVLVTVVLGGVLFIVSVTASRGLV